MWENISNIQKIYTLISSLLLHRDWMDGLSSEVESSAKSAKPSGSGAFSFLHPSEHLLPINTFLSAFISILALSIFSPCRSLSNAASTRKYIWLYLNSIPIHLHYTVEWILLELQTQKSIFLIDYQKTLATIKRYIRCIHERFTKFIYLHVTCLTP